MRQEVGRNFLFVHYSYVKTVPMEMHRCVYKCGGLSFFSQNNSYIMQNNSGWKGPQERSGPTSYSEQGQLLWGQTRPTLCPPGVIPKPL